MNLDTILSECEEITAQFQSIRHKFQQYDQPGSFSTRRHSLRRGKHSRTDREPPPRTLWDHFETLNKRVLNLRGNIQDQVLQWKTYQQSNDNASPDTQDASATTQQSQGLGLRDLHLDADRTSVRHPLPNGKISTPIHRQSRSGSTTEADQHSDQEASPQRQEAQTTSQQPQRTDSTPEVSVLNNEKAKAFHPGLDNSAVSVSTPISKFHLTREQMGKGITSHLAKFTVDPTFGGVVSIQAPPFEWENLRQKIPLPSPDHDLRFVQWEGCDGMEGVSRLRVTNHDLPEWTMPNLSHPVDKPSDAEALAFLEQLAREPPTGPIDYYVGESLLPDFDSLLHPGEQLRLLQPLPGINTPYWHLGMRGSGTALHCEDARWRSFNFVLGHGWKIWLVIRKHDNAKLEAFMRRHWKLGECDQRLRHPSLFIAPSILRENGVGFDIYCLGPNEMMVTDSEQYHTVANFTPCLAAAVNYLHPGEPTFPRELVVCSDCGLWNFEHQSFVETAPPPRDDTMSFESDEEGDAGLQIERKRKANTKLKRAPKQARLDEPTRLQQNRSYSKAISILEARAKEIRDFDPLCNVPNFYVKELPSPRVLLLAAAIRSRSAVSQLCDLIESDRNLYDCHQRNPPRETEDQFIYCLKAILLADKSVKLGQLRMRALKLRLFDLIDSQMAGRTRADTNLTQLAQKEAGCPPSTYYMYKQEGGKWRALAGLYNGLLCLITLSGGKWFGVTAKDYLGLDETDIGHLHILLDDDYTMGICSAAHAFQNSMALESPPVEFIWETSGINLQTCEEKEMIRQLQPFPSTDTNIWDPSRFSGSTRPMAWPEECPWPADPTALQPDEPQCDFCDTHKCICSATVLGVVPRIKRYPEGQGLQAVASHAGAVAYKKDSFIGMVTGELFPLGSYEDAHWTFDFPRQDLQGCPTMCQIRMEDSGSSFRLLTSAENPTARLVEKRRAGRWVMAVEAERDIRDNDQITVASVPWSRPGVTSR